MSKDKEKRARIEAEKVESKTRLAHHSNAENEKPKYKTIDEELYACVFHQYSVNGLGNFNGRSKNEHRRALEIARHLFGKYKVPKILNDVWIPVELDHHRRMDPTRDLRVVNTTRTVVPGASKPYRPWYITIASGGSFYKEHVKDFLTRKEAHAFLECPHEITILEALKFAIASQAGADAGMALRIARCKVGFNQLKIDRWRDVLRFFAREVPASVKEADDIIDWITEKFNEDENFRISGHGYTLESIRKKVTDWHYALRRLKVMGNHSWEGHLLPNFKFEERSKFNRGKMDVWTITQILSSTELAAEGTAQHHCVYSYRSRCASGDCSIWSVKFNDNRKITMEVTNDGRIIQIRGYANRSAHADELHVIGRWAQENLLRVTNSRW